MSLVLAMRLQGQWTLHLMIGHQLTTRARRAVLRLVPRRGSEPVVPTAPAAGRFRSFKINQDWCPTAAEPADVPVVLRAGSLLS